MESPSTATDAQLVAATLSGSLAAFEALVLRHQDRLYLQALRYMRAKEEAQDALQDAFLKAFNQLENLQEHSRFPSWLSQILRNICLNRLRDNRRRQATSVVEVTYLWRTSRAARYPQCSVRGTAFKASCEKRPSVYTALSGGVFDSGCGSSGTNDPFRCETAAIQGAPAASGGDHSHGKGRQEQARSARRIRSTDHCPTFATGQEGSIVHEDG